MLGVLVLEQRAHTTGHAERGGVHTDFADFVACLLEAGHQLSRLPVVSVELSVQRAEGLQTPCSRLAHFHEGWICVVPKSLGNTVNWNEELLSNGEPFPARGQKHPFWPLADGFELCLL